MPTIGDLVEARGLGAATPEMPLDEPPMQTDGGGVGIDFSFLTRETGPGSIDDYLDHPLNAKRSRGLAQVIRGATGLFGEGLRAALADIVIGGLAFMHERRLEAAASAD